MNDTEDLHQGKPQVFNLSLHRLGLESVSDNRQYRAIGNAVPPVLMWNVVNALANSCVKQKINIDDIINFKQQETVNEL